MKKLLLKIAYSILRHYEELPLGSEVELGGIISLRGQRFYITQMDLCHYSGGISTLSVDAREVMLYGGD